MNTTPNSAPTRTRFARRGVSIQTKEIDSSNIPNNSIQSSESQSAISTNTTDNANAILNVKNDSSSLELNKISNSNKYISKLDSDQSSNHSSSETSFRKSILQNIIYQQYPGTFPSPKSTPPLVSTGSSCLDSILLTPNHSSTSIPLTSLIVLKSDLNTNYAHHLLRYFAAEGITNGQGGVHCAWLGLLSAFDYTREKQDHGSSSDLASKDKQHSNNDLNVDTNDIKTSSSFKLDESNINLNDEKVEQFIKEKQSELKIAWQYRDLVEKQIKRNVRFEATVEQSLHCHDFDLSKEIQNQYLESVKNDIKVLNLEDGVSIEDLEDLVSTSLKTSIQRMENYNPNDLENSKNPVQRIILEHFGSNMYFCKESSTEKRNKCLIQFLHKLKYLLRKSASVCFITLPANGISSSLEEAVYSIADLVLDMYSFTGSNVDVSHSYELSGYTGMINIKKLPHFNTATAHFFPEILSYVFKLKRRKMYIEKLHLPPEETRVASDPNRKKYEDKPKSILKNSKESQLKDKKENEDSNKEVLINSSKLVRIAQPDEKSNQLKQKVKRSVGFAPPIGGVDKKDLEF